MLENTPGEPPPKLAKAFRSPGNTHLLLPV
ncbi:protein of unknown function [Pararobbsia alpina]